jgi:protein SCO1
MKKIKFSIILFAWISLLGMVHAQEKTTEPEVGIAEHLGSTIPLDLTFMNEKNEKVSLRSIINKPTVLTLVYFDCPGLCSPLLDGVSDVIEQADMVLGKDYQILTISFNFNDTPEKAVEKKKNFLRKHSKDHAKDWIYLTGDSVNISKIKNAVGFITKKVGVDYIHAACITILSPSGKVTRYLYGTHFLPFDLKMAIVEAQKEQARPTINRVLEFCFSYDPQGKRYMLEVTRLTGTIVLFFALIMLAVLLITTRSKKKKVVNKNNPKE